MKFLTTWSFPTGVLPEAAQRFLAGEAAPEEGVKLLGRWHNIDLSGGFLLSESDNPIALYKGAAKWGDLCEWPLSFKPSSPRKHPAFSLCATL